MPKFLERKLKAEYGANSTIPYKVMNAKGYMRGNKETAKGKALDAKHAAKSAKPGSLLAASRHGFAAQHPHKNLGAFLHPKKSR